MPDQKNLIAAIGLSLLVLIGYHYFIERPRLEKMRDLATQEAARTPAPEVKETAPALPATREDVLEETARRIKITTPSVTGSINLKGARFDDLLLAKYFTTLEKTDNVILLSPVGTEAPYYIEQGWLADNVRTPSADTVWQSSDNELTPQKPVTLRWNNGGGVIFIKTISVDDNYMFTITQKIENQTGKEITVYPYARIMRLHHQDVKNSHTVDSSMGLVAQGLLGVVDGKYESATYDKLTEKPELKEESKTFSSTGGWLGITDKYWVTALIPNQQSQITARYVRTGDKIMGGSWPFRHTAEDKRDFQADWRAAAQKIPAGASGEDISHLFAGAKEMRVLDAYEKSHNIPRFDLVVDFGWFYIITKPFFYFLTWIAQHVGNFGLAILIFTLVIRGAMYPIAAQSYRSMQHMKEVSPKMKELQAKYKDDPTRLQGEMMAFYKREKINPMAGCIPMLIQIPIFFSLYKVLYVTLEMRHAEFLWKWKDLSAPDPTNIFNLFGIIPFDPPTFLHFGLLPILMGLTTFVQMQLSPPSPDPTQRQVMMMMPWLMMIMMAGFPAGLLVYWTFSNILAIAQQWWIKRQSETK